jgi:hypothetical protein
MSDATVQLQVGDETISFTLNFTTWRWSSASHLTEGDFPLIAVVEGKRYELYSDGTLAEVEL